MACVESPEPAAALEKIAIIGMSCRLPGNVCNVNDFLDMLSKGRSGWSEIPQDRFTKEAFYHPHPQKKGCFNATGGYFLNKDLAKFEASFFNATEQEARAMDPQQRLLLECTYEALENAGLPKEVVAGRHVGVFVGGAAADYHLGATRDLETIPMFEATGTHQSIQAGRISHFFDLRGPCLTVDAACSSGLSALHQAVQSIRAGESEMCIVAAAHVNLQPDDWVSMSMSGLLSDHSKTYSFDHRGQPGYARGEGAACVVVKPLEQAIKDNDPIRSVIVNTGISQDGRTVGLATPSGEAQEQLIRSVYRRAKLDMGDVGFVEAHGTATKIGDPIEARAIYNALGRDRDDTEPLYLGSAKSNVGHLENVSGLVAIIKSTLMLENNTILPNINFEKANKEIPLTEWNMQVPTRCKPWPSNKRFLSVNNLGFGGSNAHCVLQHAPSISRAQVPPSQADHADYKLYPVSGRTCKTVENICRQLEPFAKTKSQEEDSRLATDLAYTLGQRRSHMSWRTAFAASSIQELQMTMKASTAVPCRATKAPKLAFIFTGQGAQWHAMGRELFASRSVFRDCILAADACLRSFGADFSLVDELARDAAQSRIHEPQISQPACTAIQIALVKLLSSWNIKPIATLGHSSGEIAAAFAAGGLTLHDALAIAYHRGDAASKLKARQPNLRGAMLAIHDSASKVRDAICLLGLKANVCVACENSPQSTTASGDATAVDKLSTELDRQNISNKKLYVDIAYHSAHMALLSADYAAAIEGVAPMLPKDAIFYSSLHGGVMENDSLLSASYWTENLTQPVLFSSALSALCKQVQPSAIVELGPHSALQGPIQQILQSISAQIPDIRYMPSLIRNQNASKTMAKLAGDLYQLGQPLDFGAVNGIDIKCDKPAVTTQLTPYPWQGESYWFESRISQQRRLKPFGRHDLLGVYTEQSTDLDHAWRNNINTDFLPWLKQHQMQSLTTFPFAGYVSMVVEAVQQRATLRGITAFDQYVVREMHVSRPLLIEDDKEYELILSLRPYAQGTRAHSDEWDEFRITSWTQHRGWLEHCHGIAGVRTRSVNLVEKQQQQNHRPLHTEASGECHSPVDVVSFYANLARKGASYGELFQLRQESQLRRSDQVAKGQIYVPDTAAQMPVAYETPYIIHPAILDQCFHFPFAILGAGTDEMQTLYMPTMIKRLEIGKSLNELTSSHPMDIVATRYPSVNSSLGPVSFDVEGWLGAGTDKDALIRLSGIQMTPVRDTQKQDCNPRRLCFRMTWEPAKKEEPQMNGTATNGITTNGTSSGNNKSATAVVANGTTTNGTTTNGVSGTTIAPSTSEEPLQTNGETSPTQQIIIISERDDDDPLVSRLLKLLSTEATYYATTICSLDKLSVENATYIALCDLENPILPDINDSTLATLKQLLLESAALIWVSIGLSKNAQHPTLNMMQGLIRTVRSEYKKQAATLDLDPGKTDINTRAQLILEVLDNLNAPETSHGLKDFEFAQESSRLVVPRLAAVPGMDEALHRRSNLLAKPYHQAFEQTGRRLQLQVGQAGALDSLYFTDEPEQQVLADDEIEVKVVATGANFKDAVIAVGHLASPYIGIECSGTITRVGATVQSLAVGDQVCCMSLGAYSTFARAKASSAARVPSGMSLEVAASIPVVFCTAYYGLVELAHLQPGERVLIHAGAGGVGQAAIQLAKMIGAEIFTTVGSTEKKHLLISKYGIPEDHILYSRSTGFGAAIQTLTAGNGVDVALNSLAGDLLIETWDCMAAFGRFVEIGKRDITWNTRLEMRCFDQNVTFSSVDLTLLSDKRPGTMSRVLSAVMNLFAQGSLSPVSPITVMGISEVEAALRLLQSGKSTGKIVIRPQPGEQAKATHPRATRNLRANGTYLIIGGTGGVGRAIAGWMAERGAGHVVLLSRGGGSGASTELGLMIDQCAALGTSVHIEACDVADELSVQELMVTLARLPPVVGVIQAAMVLRDMLFEEMTVDDFEAVTRAKVHGTWNIHRALVHHKLDFFTLLSSLTGIVGNRGQAAYAAANTFLDSFAQYRLQQGMPANSIALTPVLDAGYLADNVHRQAQVLDNIGDITLSIKEVLALVECSIDGQMTNLCGSLCVLGLDFDRSAVLRYYADDAKFTHLLPSSGISSHAAAAAGDGATTRPLRQQIGEALEPQDMLDIVLQALQSKLCAVLMLQPEDMDANGSVTSHGLDSLNAIEFRNWVRKELLAPLQVLELLSSGTLVNLAALILRKTSIVHCYK